MAIHGGTKNNIEPVVEGMLDTLTSRCSVKTVSKKILTSNPSLVKSVCDSAVSTYNKDYYLSEQNMLRSLNCYYSHNVLGKRKYTSIRRANSNSTFRGLGITNYVSYSLLAKRINGLDIGTLHDVSSLDHDNKDVKGVYRNPAEYILRLAKFYLTVNENRVDKLKTFDNILQMDSDAVLFLLAFGGDSAPICGMSFLVSFLNVGKRIASSSEQFLLLGADVDETSKSVSNFVLKLVADIKYLESETFVVQCGKIERKVEFKLGELPNDMKMLCFLAGELSNSAFYFSTFGNVTQTNCSDHQKRYGEDPTCEWKPFEFTKRISDSEKVMIKKKELEKSTVTEATKRNKLTSYISQNLKSRQESQPLVDQYINHAKAEPLHLKNNTVKERFMQLLKLCISQSKLQSVKTYREIPVECLFYKFVDFIHYSMSCNFLAKKIKTWFNESCGKVEKDFTFRFRGKESFLYMKHFPSLIKMILSYTSNEQIRYRLHQIFFESLRLRQVLSYSVRIEDFDENMVLHMKKEANALFHACCFYEQRISPSLWTLCNVAPYHAEKCLELYGFGLGCNTMEGREQKHQAISKYAENTTFQNRWPLIFRHEYVQLIHLRENGFDRARYNKRIVKYVPDIGDGCCTKCGLSLATFSNCVICDSSLMKKIEGKALF